MVRKVILGVLWWVDRGSQRGEEVQLKDWCGNSGNERVKARNVIMAVEMGRKACLQERLIYVNHKKFSTN